MRSPQSSQLAAAALATATATLATAIYAGLVASTMVPAASAAVTAPRAPALSTSWSFASSGLDGAGFQNVVAASPYRAPTGNRPILVGADVAGIHRSTDGGRTWVSSDEGLPDAHVAGFMWSWDVPGKVYVATKTAISVSTDWGWTWQRQAGRVAFDPNGAWQVTPGEEHPRSTGRLLEQATVGATHYLWAGTATQGVKRSADDGRTWQQTSLVGAHVRAIRLDPHNPDVLYVAVAHAGLYVSRNARDGLTFTPVPGSPPEPEELTFVDDMLYVVANTAGVFSYDGSWHSLNAGIPAGSAWESITGYTAPAGNSVLFVGCTDPQNGKAVMKSTDGGQTWTAVTTGSGVTVSPLVYGSSRPWWANGIGYLSFAGRSYVASQLIVDPDDHNSLLIAGRGGVWRGSPAGSGTTWSPAMNGLMVTVNMAVAADAKVAGRLFIGNMDYTSFGSTDGGADVVRTMPTGAPSTGDVVTLDSGTDAGQPSAVYLAASRRGGSTGDGGIWSSADPLRGTWQSERLPVSSDVTALGVGHPSTGRIILAGVSQHGFWRKSGSTWTRITGAAPFQSQSTGSFAWVQGGTTVYALDSVGVWRSAAAGAAGSWTKLMNASSDYRVLDALVVDPADSDTVYVSAKGLGGVWRISGAGTAAPSRTRILGLRDPGPIAVDAAGDLFVHDIGAVALRRSTDPGDLTPSFTVVSDDYYHTNNRMIRSLSIGPDGYIYTASNHAGVTVGVPPASAG